MDKPHGTTICPRCQSIQSGTLDLVCDGCNLPLWEKEVLEYGIAVYRDNQKDSADCLSEETKLSKGKRHFSSIHGNS